MNNNVLFRLAIGLGLVAGFLSACRSQPPVTTAVEVASTALPTKANTPTIKPTKSPTSSQRTDTPTATAQTMSVEPSATRKPIEPPTLTLHPPTITAISQRTNTPTATAQITSTEPPELALRETQFASFSATCDGLDNNSIYTLLSPKGNWLARICDHDQTLRIYSKTSKKWVLQFKDFVDKQFVDNGQPPRGRLYPVHWTNDEMYLYFRSTLSISAGGTCFYGGRGQGLYRLELANGAVTATLPPLMDAGLYLFSFSPSGRWLVYNSGVPTIRNLQTGEEIILHEWENAVGDFAWSPDGSELAYSTCQPSEDYDNIKKSSIKIFSLETLKSRTILEADTENVFLRIELIDLDEGNRLKIYEGNSYQRNYTYFDWSTEQWITPTLTPTPTFLYSSTPTRTPTIHPVQTVTVDSGATLTEEARVLRDTQIASFNLTCGDVGQNVASLSPDGNWLALYCGYKHDQTLKIVNHEGKQWILLFKDYLAAEFKESGGLGALYPKHWVDGDYLYFVSSLGFSGGNDLYRERWEGGQGLYRINLSTGTVSATLPPLKGAVGYDIAFSPDGRRLAYTYDHLKILDLKTGDEITIQVGDGFVGFFTWSPDSLKLAYATWLPTQDFLAIIESRVRIFSLDTNISKTILEVKEKPLYVLENENMRLEIADFEQFDYSKATRWYYDWISGQLITPTLTPTP